MDISEQIAKLQDAREKLDATMDRLAKCKKIPKADLQGKYRKSYEQLKATAQVQGNEAKTLMVFGGFQVRHSDYPVAEAMTEEIMAALPARTAIKTAADALKQGDKKTFYSCMVSLRQHVRSVCNELDGTEDQIFRMYAEAIET